MNYIIGPIENNVFSRFKNKKITIVHILLQVQSRNRHTFFLAVFEFLKIIIGLPIRIFFPSLILSVSSGPNVFS